MAIRIKEWGMLHAPQSPARIPVENLHGWVDATQRLGRGIVSSILGTQQLLQDEEKVTAEGGLAAFSEQLHRIGHETAAELAAQAPEDWDYAWQRASAPRLAAAVAALPPAARKAGVELAEAYNAQASLRARRDYKIKAIEQARHHWQQRIDHAVEAGDATRAEQWLQSGENIFVPSSELELRKTQAKSQACVARWRKSLAAEPIKALANYRSAAAEQLPTEEEDRRALDAEVMQLATGARTDLAQDILAGKYPYPQSLRPTIAAGILSPAEYEQACTPPRELSTTEQIEWMRRIDESDDTPAAQTDLLMAIATAPMQPQMRKSMSERAHMAANIAADDRRVLSRRLLYLFSQSGFGCPRDPEAQQRMRTLQQNGLAILAEHGTEATAEWLRGVSAHCDAWVCFSDLN